MSGASPVLQRVVRYGLAGLLATVLYFLAAVTLVEWAHAPPVVAAVLATIIVMATSYIVNRLWVFETTRAHASSVPRFVAASLVSIGLNASIMYLTVHVLGWQYVTGLVLTTAVVPPVNFAMNYLWAFRPDDGAGRR
jgi:putative flippase GtrA